MRAVIIGAGVAGLGIGWRLLQAGWEVTILDRGQPGFGATRAAAGMLAVTAELQHAPQPERDFALVSNRLWPEFVTELEQASGRDIGFRRSGTLLLAADAAEREAISGALGNPKAGAEELAQVVAIFSHYDTLGRTLQRAEQHAERAVAALAPLPAGEMHQLVADIAHFTVGRAY